MHNPTIFQSYQSWFRHPGLFLYYTYLHAFMPFVSLISLLFFCAFGPIRLVLEAL